MKTTLELPDDLYRKAKATAALRGETLTSLLGQALESIVANQNPSAQKSQKLSRKSAVARSQEQRISKWREDEAAFLQQMSGRNRDKRNAAEIVGERRRG